MANEKIGDGDAFPCTNGSQGFPGMTYRQWLIGQALAGFCSIGGIGNRATLAIEYADEVLKQLEPERTEE